MLVDEDEIENFREAMLYCRNHYDGVAVYEIGKKLKLNPNDFIECFAIIAFMRTRTLHKPSRKTYMKDVGKQLISIQKKSQELAELINTLPTGGVREWFDVGDKTERLDTTYNPAALQCMVFSRRAEWVLQNQVNTIPQGYYNPFLDGFLRWYFYALRLYRTKNLHDFLVYVESSWHRDRNKIKKVFAQVVCLGLKPEGFGKHATHDDLKKAGDTFDNNIDAIYQKVKKEYCNDHSPLRTTQ